MAEKSLIYLSVMDIEDALEKDGIDLGDYSLLDFILALYSVGFDPRWLEYEEVLHKPACRGNSAEPVVYGRIISYERQDKEWLANKMCSFDNIIASQDDKWHKADLLSMSRRINVTDVVIANELEGVEGS